MSARRERIAVLLSGGVDSALALALLREAGHRLTAFYLKIWLEEELAFLGDCPWEEDLRYARAVCHRLRVPLEVVPFQAEYRQAVVQYVLGALRAGHTPSPDVLCNRAIKFGAFVDRVRGDYDAVASGHYARLEQAADGHARLLRGVDPAKDQSYFLAYLRRQQLDRLRFPLGALHKHQVRAMARERGLAPSGRKDSQGICFLGKLSYPAFVRAHLGETPGPIREFAGGARARHPPRALVPHHRPAPGPGSRRRPVVRGSQGRGRQHGVRGPPPGCRGPRRGGAGRGQLDRAGGTGRPV